MLNRFLCRVIFGRSIYLSYRIVRGITRKPVKRWRNSITKMLKFDFFSEFSFIFEYVRLNDLITSLSEQMFSNFMGKH